MWPNLDHFGVKISLSKADNSIRVEPLDVEQGTAAETLNTLTSFGFVSAGGGMKLSDTTRFKASDLTKWFNGFDTKTMIDADAPIAYYAEQEIVAEETVAEKKKRDKIEDYGEKIGGAKKDRHGSGVQGTGESDGIGSPTATADLKDLWVYSYQEAHDAGVSSAVANYIKQLRLAVNRVLTKTGVNPIYESAIGLMKDVLTTDVKTGLDLAKALILLRSDTRYKTFKEEVFRNEFVRRDFNLIHGLIRTNISSLQSYLKSLSEKGYPLYRFPESAFQDFCDKGFELCSASRESALWDKILPKTRQTKKVDPDAKKTPERPHLALLKNEWLPDHDVTTEELAGRFGFRAIEWGNWLPQDERQTVLNEAYGACAALAHATGLPEKMVSLNGELAAAFGSRGAGKASAHFEPSNMVFNLTRMKGAGSMAHEYAHALDYWLGKERFLSESVSLNLCKDPNSASDFMAITVASMKQATLGDWVVETISRNLNNHIANALYWCIDDAKGSDAEIELRQQLMGAVLEFSGLKMSSIIQDFGKPIDLSASDMVIDKENTEKRIANEHTAVVDDVLNDICARASNGSVRPRCVYALKSLSYYTKYCVSQAIDLSARLKNGESPTVKDSIVFAVQLKAKQSEYETQSKLLDGKRAKPYWATNREMFARAFESHVYDVLQKEDKPMFCDYLVHSVGGEFSGDSYTGNPYPSGTERVAISKNIGDMLSFMADRIREKEYDETKQSKPTLTAMRA